MHRLWPLLLLLLLQPLAAAAEVPSYGSMASVAPSVPEAAPERPRQEMLPADGLQPGASMRFPGERSDWSAPETASRAAPRLRAPRPSRLPRPSAAPRAASCSPHCERLPYDSTAPPLP